MNYKATAGISFDPYNFEFNGSVTASAVRDRISVSEKNDLLMVYVDEELRGLSQALYFDPTGSWAFSLMAYSNLAEGEEFSFHYYDASEDSQYDCHETLLFSQDMIVGNAFEPFLLNLGQAVGIQPFTPGEMITLDIKPNPFTGLLNVSYTVPVQERVRLEVLDMTGRKVHILEERMVDPGTYSLTWNAEAMEDGTYLLRMITGHSTLVQKAILIK